MRTSSGLIPGRKLLKTSFLVTWLNIILFRSKIIILYARKFKLLCIITIILFTFLKSLPYLLVRQADFFPDGSVLWSDSGTSPGGRVVNLIRLALNFASLWHQRHKLTYRYSNTSLNINKLLSGQPFRKYRSYLSKTWIIIF